MPLTWPELITQIRDRAPGVPTMVPKAQIVHPLSVPGAHRALGLPQGQIADWRFTLEDCRSVHVKEYADIYAVHLDRVDPDCSPTEHWRQDVPPNWKAALLAAGALGLLATATAAVIIFRNTR